MSSRVICGDVLTVLGGMDDNIYHGVLCDPPYGLKFMGKAWDHGVPGVDVWAEVLRVCRPGAHLLAFGGSRTFHRLVCAIEDAGWEIRDSLQWIYGSGFPKSHDVCKALDKESGTEFSAQPATGVGFMNPNGDGGYNVTKNRLVRVGGMSDLAKQWDGYNTALKPAHEPIVLARKPLDGTVANNVQKWGCGALWIAGCRVGTEILPEVTKGVSKIGTFEGADGNITPQRSGRWPANIIHDGSDEVVSGFPDGQPPKKQRIGLRGGSPIHGSPAIGTPDKVGVWPGDNGGSASRFFYCAKASKKERGDGNNHPTVKPTTLTEYLARLIIPANGGKMLVPFSGSGSEMIGALNAGWGSVTGIEREQDYAGIAVNRLQAVREIDAVLTKYPEKDV